MRTCRLLKRPFVLLLGTGLLFGCAFDDTLRAYLNAHFWLPFAKSAANFERRNVRRISAPFAGMAVAEGGHLAGLRSAYQKISTPDPLDRPPEVSVPRQALEAARADPSLTKREREEVALLDAKVDMRAASPQDAELLERAKKKLIAFLATARTPEFRSEARGWLAHIDYLLGDQTGAGKIYLDELNRDGSNLSRETLLNSLRLNYGYDGGPELLSHLQEYFDTPEHAAFAIQLVTNPHWTTGGDRFPRDNSEIEAQTYSRVVKLLEAHRELLRSKNGVNTLALLTMRTALRMGDPAGAKKIADSIPSDDQIHAQPDFNWMLASSNFLSHDYAAAEAPLLGLFRSPLASESQKAAAAYGLCGVYQKTGNTTEQLRYALWLYSGARKNQMWLSTGLSDLSVYWAVSGWDLNLLLETDASVDQLRSFVSQNPDLQDIGLVKYSLAVRLTRENRYSEAADIYQSIHALRRAPRIRRLADLYSEANRTDLNDSQRNEAKLRLAEFLSANPDRIYYNDALWHGLQRYALEAEHDDRLTRRERDAMIASERKLQDDQEERWRAYLILREVIGSDTTYLRPKAATLALECLRGISDRFGRQEEIRKADIELRLLR